MIGCDTRWGRDCNLAPPRWSLHALLDESPELIHAARLGDRLPAREPVGQTRGDGRMFLERSQGLLECTQAGDLKFAGDGIERTNLTGVDAHHGVGVHELCELAILNQQRQGLFKVWLRDD